MSEIVKTVGTVLGRFDFGNTSRIFCFLTPDCGRVDALAKGARRGRGRPGLGGGLDLLSENEILYYQRRTGLAVLAEWAELPGFPELPRDPVRFAAGEVCAEFARWCSAEGQGEPETYRLLARGLALAARAERLVPAALWAALGMLSAAGYRPRAESCAACGRGLGAGARGNRWLLSARAGGLVCRRCAGSAGPGPDGGGALSAEGCALLGALLRLPGRASARLRPSRRAEGELLAAVESYASWRLERRMRGLSGLSAIIAGLEAAGCR